MNLTVFAFVLFIAGAAQTCFAVWAIDEAKVGTMELLVLAITSSVCAVGFAFLLGCATTPIKKRP